MSNIYILSLPRKVVRAAIDAGGGGFIAVEFDTLMDMEFNDINVNHIGMDFNSVVLSEVVDLTSIRIDLKSGDLINAWIEFNGLNDFMYMGFSGSMQGSTKIHKIEWWSFGSSSNAGQYTAQSISVKGANGQSLGTYDSATVGVDSDYFCAIETVVFVEYECKGKGAFRRFRVPWSKSFCYQEARSFLDKNFIDGEQWLRLYLHPSSLKVICAIYRQQTSEEQMSKGDGSQEGEQPHAMLIPMEYFFMGRGLYRPAQGAL
ncbi:hypothetical protein Fmac_020485 [Flemingia macrophylla]|uniref:Legume lectin domain-containing protein n=1 Tax=Flemingia macrophylla TaxID=520843 RepID=A0ABD1LU48_9FABA